MANEDLEQILYNQGMISRKDIEEAKVYAKNTSQDLATVLIEIGKLTEESIAFAISNELGIPLIEIIPDMVDMEKIRTFSSETLWRCRAVPLFQGEEILIVMSNPLDDLARDELVELFGADNISFAISTSSSILEILQSCFQQSNFSNDTPNKITPDDPGAILFITRHLNEAYQVQATEIDFRIYEKELQIYYRMDGKMIRQESVPSSFSTSIIQHCKTLAGLPPYITEIYQRPFSMNIQGEISRLKLTFLHTGGGDRISIQYESPRQKHITLSRLSQIGFNKEEIQRIFSLPNGLILLANPDLMEIRKIVHSFLEGYQQKKIFSLEIGITRTLSNIVQIDLNHSRFTWENIISENPDVVYIEGKVPDQYWPYLASTRLIWMAIPAPSNVDALCSVYQQIPDLFLSRILRGILVFAHLHLLCSQCKKKTDIPELLVQLEPSLGEVTAMQAKGCPNCKNTGYEGEIILMDMIWADKILREFLANNPSRYDIANHLGDFGNSILNQMSMLVEEEKIDFQEIWKWI